MSNPKEKAKELVKIFTPFSRTFDNKTGWCDSLRDAKQCALICQENLLKKLKELNIKDDFEEDVLLEINAL